MSTVFVGGGTPSLVGAGPLTALLDAVRDRFGLTPDAEVTTEANPESTDPALLGRLREAGYTRLSLGMQSTSTRVLRILDRTHTAGRALDVVGWARSAGFEHVNLDLIYGTPGETDAEFADSLLAAVDSGVDHVSAYSLIVEPGTRLARQVRTGALPMPDDDVLADRYLQADAALTAAGFSWYEVSNWARDAGARCRHNLAYWTGGDWWGVGPGAHSHVGGVRWWNVKHPAAYAAALAAGRTGRSPIADGLDRGDGPAAQGTPARCWTRTRGGWRTSCCGCGCPTASRRTGCCPPAGRPPGRPRRMDCWSRTGGPAAAPC